MSSGAGSAGIWPADIIHVNEDGWVLINRGGQHGVPVGLRLLVVGAGARELRDLFAGEHAGQTPDTEQEAELVSESEEPVVLRTRRTYELLEVVHVEPACAIAIAARAPAERHPQFYRGPHGELLVWVPLPPTFTYPQPNANSEDEEEDEAEEHGEPPYDQEPGAEDGEMGGVSGSADVPPQRTEQEDERWEEALPLNGVGVGDQVVPAVPVGPAQPTMSGPATNSANSSSSAASPTGPSTSSTSNPFEAGKEYDWLKPES